MRFPYADVCDLERRRDIEKSLTYSPFAILGQLILLAGTGGMAITLFDWENLFPLFFGLGLFAVGAIWLVLRDRLLTVHCHGCGHAMERYTTDMEEDDFPRWLATTLYAFEVEGRFYGKYRQDADDGKWVRLMRDVAICEECRCFAVTRKYIRQPVSGEDAMIVAEFGPLHKLTGERHFDWEHPAQEPAY